MRAEKLGKIKQQKKNLPANLFELSEFTTVTGNKVNEQTTKINDNSISQW